MYPGVYQGLDLEPSSTTGELKVNAGSFLIPAGLLVVETDAFYLPLTPLGFPPALPTNYTVFSRYQPIAMGLIGGGPVTYSITASLLTSPPFSDSTILGWIRHPGGGVALSTDHITSAPKLNPWDLLRLAINRRPYRVTPPAFTSELGTGTTYTTTYTAPNVESVFSVPLGTPIVTQTTARISFPIINGVGPYSVRIKSAFNAPLAVAIFARDSAGTPVANTTAFGRVGYAWDEIVVDRSAVWTDNGTVELVFTGIAGQSLKIPVLEVIYWPYAQVP
jgi:hypothetical protein